MRLNKGFTLAEVLITLVIIGVIAAITVPTLITKYQKEQTVTRLKKAYSALSQTTQRAIADNGPLKTWSVGTPANADSNKQFLNTYLLPYLSIMKQPLTLEEGNYINSYKHLNGEEQEFSDDYVRFYLSDGTSVTTTLLSSTRAVFKIDINGDKKPNMLGKDIFELNYYFDNGIFQFSALGWTRENLLSANNTHCCNKTKSGMYCGAVIQKDSWQIKDDYPW